MNTEAPLPGWPMKSLAQIGRVEVAKLNPRAFPDETFEYYSIPAYQNDASPDLSKGSEILSHKLLIPARCVLFGKLNPRVQKVWNVRAGVERRRLASTEWLTLVPLPEVDQDYLYFLMYSDWVMPIAQTLVSGSTPSRQRVNEKGFFEIRVPVPSLREQEKIADILRLIHRSISVCRSAIAAGLTLRSEAMRRLFTQGLRDDPMKDTEIGSIPRSWEVVEVGDATVPYRFDSSKQVPASRYRSSGRWPIIDQGRKAVAGYTDRASEVLRPQEPVIVFGDHTRVFKYVDYPFAVGAQGTRLLQARPGFNPRYLYYALDSLDIEDRGYNRHMTVLKDKSVAKPLLEEQCEIAQVLNAIDLKLDLHRRKKVVLEQLFRTLLHDLMTGRIRADDLELPDIGTDTGASTTQDGRK